jgi:hypothetical protein
VRHADLIVTDALFLRLRVSLAPDRPCGAGARGRVIVLRSRVTAIGCWSPLRGL